MGKIIKIENISLENKISWLFISDFKKGIKYIGTKIPLYF